MAQLDLVQRLNAPRKNSQTLPQTISSVATHFGVARLRLLELLLMTSI